MSDVSAERVRTAHADAWQVLGVAGACDLPGVRLSATGLAHPQWNNGDVDDPARVDIASVRRWYDDVGVPWGIRVAAGARWPHGRRLFTKRLMGLAPSAFRPAADAADVRVREAGPDDLEAYVHVDTIAFEESPQVERPWLQLLLDHPAATVAVAESVDGIVASGHVVRSDGRAGAAAYVGGIAVLPASRRLGIGAAVTTWLIARSGEAGARLWHLHPDTDDAARIYRRLGFAELDGLDIYVDN